MTEPDIVSRVLAAQGDPMEVEQLIEDYLPFISSVTSAAVGHPVSIGENDELAIAMAGFHDAVRTYSRLRGAFLKYATVVMRNRIIDYQRKEKRHRGAMSLNEEMDGSEPLLERIADGRDAYGELERISATKEELAEIAAELRGFGISLTDIAGECPQQDRTLTACHRVVEYAKKNPELIAELKRTRRLPVGALCAGSGIERKTLERHRKYVIALLIIYSNGFELIRAHLREVFIDVKGGARA